MYQHFVCLRFISVADNIISASTGFYKSIDFEGWTKLDEMWRAYHLVYLFGFDTIYLFK